MSARPQTRCCRVVIALAMWCLAFNAFGGPPDFPAPKRAAVRQIAESMVIGGRQMSVRGFTTGDDVARVVQFYQELWREPPEKGAPAVVYEPDAMAPWHLLTRVEDGYIMTVQVQPVEDEGSYGYLALGRLPKKDEGPLPEPPAPPSMQDSRVFSNVTSDDDGKSAQTSMLNNTKSVTSNINFYRNHYSGWRKDVDQDMGDGKHHALGFTRGREQVIITIQATQQGGTNVIVNQVKHDLL